MIGTKMEGGGGEGEGENRPAVRKRGTHCTLVWPAHAPSTPTPSPLSGYHHHINLPGSGALPQTPWGEMSGPSDRSPLPQAEGGKKRQASQSLVSRCGETFRERRPGTHPHPVSLPLPLLRMCLPDILCPRFSPEGPERPARTEDASRGESRICRARGLRRALEGTGGSPPS